MKNRLYKRVCPVCGNHKRYYEHNFTKGSKRFAVTSIKPIPPHIVIRVRCGKCGSSWKEVQHNDSGEVYVHVITKQEKLPGF